MTALLYNLTITLYVTIRVHATPSDKQHYKYDT